MDPGRLPRVYHDGWIDLEMDAETLPLHPWPEAPRDDFDAPKLAPRWMFLRNPRPDDWSLSAKPGWLRLQGSAVTLNEHDSPAFVCRRQQHFDCRASVRLEFNPQRSGEEAGLSVYANPEHHYEIALTREDGALQVIVRRRIGDLVALVAREPVAPGPLTLAIEADATQYAFRYARDGGDLRTLATGATRYLAVEVTGAFTGVVFGMYATGNGQPSATPADFDWFEYTVNE